MSKKPTETNERMQRHSKIYWVPIPLIKPSDVAQRRFRFSRAAKMAQRFDIDRLGLPVMNRRGNNFRCIDGQHRIWCLKEVGLGEEKVECEVYEGLSDREEAEVFVERNNRAAVGAFDNFKVCCHAQYPRELDILRTVEAQRLKVSQARDEGCVGSVVALGRAYDKWGSLILGRALRAIRDGFAADCAAFDGTIIEGMAMVIGRYNSGVNEPRLVRQLNGLTHGVLGLQRRAENLRQRTGNTKPSCVAGAIVDAYNKGGRAGQLPSWWRES